MTRTISLLASSGLAALALAPAGWANHQYGDAFIGAQSPDVFERGLRPGQPDFWNYDRQSGMRITDTSPSVRPSDVAGLYSAGRPTQSYLVAHERALDARLAASGRATPVGVGERTTSSSGAFAWLEIGIGFGAGLVVAAGVVMGMRLMRVRRPAY